MKETGKYLRLFFSLLAITGICWITTAGCSKEVDESKPSALEQRTKIKETAVRLMEKEGIPGLSMTVIKDGKILWSEGFGVKNTETGEPVSENTVFEACSLSKPVFAYAALKLVDQGILDLDKPLLDYVPQDYIETGFVNGKIEDPRFKKITARHVLTHTSGFPNWRGKKIIPINFEPGEKFSYSGEGFMLLQKVVEKITGKPLNDLMKEYVFQPLGMTHSSYLWEERYETLATSAHNGFGFPRPLRKTKKAGAAFSLNTTAPDFARFICALLNGTGLSEESHRLMLTPQVSAHYDKEGRIPWGMGVALQRVKKEDREAFSIWHWGDNDQFKCFFLALTGEKSGLVYFANSYFGLNIVAPMVMTTVGGNQPVLSIDLFKNYNGKNGKLIELVKTRDPAEGIAFFEEMKEESPFLKKKMALPYILDFFLEAARWLAKNQKPGFAVRLLTYIKEHYPLEQHRDFPPAAKKLEKVELKLKELQEKIGLHS
jgi:CubicO group peptidase (beta-lactamase class C family)